MRKLLVVGSLNMDTVLNVSKIPQKGETILGKEISYVPGGKGANQAYAMGKLGAEVAMIGCIGADGNGSKLLQNLQSVHVDTRAIQIFQKESTGIALITVEETGENSIVVIAGANSKLTRQWIMEQQKYIDECDIVVAQLETPLDSICAVAELAKQKGKRMLLDPAPAQKELPSSLLKNVSIIKPNETEDEAKANVILTSVLKEVGNSLVRMAEMEINGIVPYGAYESLGIQEGGTGIAINEYYEKNVPEEIRTKVTEAQNKVGQGEVQITSALGEDQAKVQAIIDSVAP